MNVRLTGASFVLFLSIPHRPLWRANKGLTFCAGCEFLILVAFIFRWLVLLQQRDLWFQVPKYPPTNELIGVAPNKKRLVRRSCFKIHVIPLALRKVVRGHVPNFCLLDLQELESCHLKQRKTHIGIMQTLCKFSVCVCVCYGYICTWLSFVNVCEIKTKSWKGLNYLHSSVELQSETIVLCELWMNEWMN